MGYFSRAAADVADVAGREEQSYPSPERQWAWRVEDLLDRLEEIGPGAEECRVRYTEDDLKYALPKDLSTREAVLTAIEAARSRLGRPGSDLTPADSEVSEAESAKAA